MKIRFSSTSQFDDHYRQFLNSNKYHIISIHFNNESILHAMIRTSGITCFLFNFNIQIDDIFLKFNINPQFIIINYLSE